MVKSKLLIVSILVIAIVSLFVIPVFAEVNDDSLVNFNQLVPNDYISYTFSSSQTQIPINLISGHIYYYVINNISSSNFTAILYKTGIGQLQTFVADNYGNQITSVVVKANYDGDKILFYAPNSGSFNNFNIIDLTYMFGAGNEPTLEECKKMFIAAYPYNQGEVLSFLSFDSYNKGVQSVYDSLSYSLNASSSYNSFDLSYSISYGVGNIIGSTTLAALNYPVYPPTHGEYILQPTYYQLIVNKFGRMNLGAKINQGSTVKLSGLLSRYNLNSATKVHVGVLSYQNDFISIYSIDLPALPENKLINYINFSFDVQMPIDSDSLYFYIDGLNVNSSTTYFYIGDIQVETKDLNTQFLIDKSYNDGYDLGFNQGSQSSYNNGYNAGYNKGLESANQNTFLTLFTSVIEAPVNAVLSIFDFEVLGYNLKGFFVGLFSMALLLAIIRLFI